MKKPRKNVTERFSILRFCLIIFLSFYSRAGAENWRWNSRADMAYGLDNNIFETLSDPIADYTGRLLYHVNGSGRLTASLWTSVDYQGGVELYSSYSEENRMIHDLSLGLETPLRQGLILGFSAHARDKRFLTIQRGFTQASFSPSMRFSSANGMNTTLYFSLGRLNYFLGSEFDYTNLLGGIRLELGIWPRVTWNFQASGGFSFFNRESYDLRYLGGSIYQWISKDEKQLDRFVEMTTGLEIYQWALFGIQISYQKILSNNYGYSFVCPRLQFIAAKSFVWNLTVRFYWSLYLKGYTDDLKPLLQIWPDSENEENSFWVLDISKDFQKTLSVRLRMGWYQNESPFRDLYYQKRILSLGISRRL